MRSAGLAALALAALLLSACRGDGEGADRTQDDAEPAATQPISKSRPSPSFRAFVAIEDEDLVVILEGPPWRLVRRVGVPSGPHNITADPMGRWVAVSSPPAGRVTILDSRGRVTARAPAGSGPHDIAFTPRGSLWVSAEDSSRIVKLQVPSGKLVGSRSTGGPPHDLAVSADAGELWVTIDGSAAVEVRAAESGRLLERPTVGPAPHDVEVAPDDRTVWFSNWDSPLLTLASLPRRKRIGVLAAGGEPHHFAFGAGSLWVSDNSGGELLRVDPRSRRIRGRTSVGPEPHHVAAVGGNVLVAVHARGEVAVVSGRGRLLRRLSVGAGPHGVDVVELPG
jgi:DNA-binding beta-propeller fold protein YncE